MGIAGVCRGAMGIAGGLWGCNGNCGALWRVEIRVAPSPRGCSVRPAEVTPP
jgi:hypothetical protein